MVEADEEQTQCCYTQASKQLWCSPACCWPPESLCAAVVPAQLCISLLYMLNLPSHHASMRDRKLCQVVGMLLLVLQLHLMKAQAVVLHKEMTSHSPNIFLIVMYTHGLLHCRCSWHIANVPQ